MSPLVTTGTVSSADLERYRRDGFVVLRAAFDPEPLIAEVATAFADGVAARRSVQRSDLIASTFPTKETPREVRVRHHRDP